jgi:hypothetical protein
MKERWQTRKKQCAATPAIDAFIEEVIAVCQKHGLYISHEDGHGGFVIVNEKADLYFDWLRDASDDTNPDAKPPIRKD